MSEASGATSRLTALEEAAQEVASDITTTRTHQLDITQTLSSAADSLEAQAAIEKLKTLVAQHRAAEAEKRSLYDRIQSESTIRSQRVRSIEVEAKNWTDRNTGAEIRLEDLKNRKIEIQAQAKTLSKRPLEIVEQRTRLLEMIEESESAQQEASDNLTTGENAQNQADQTLKAAEAQLAKAREDPCPLRRRSRTNLS